MPLGQAFIRMPVLPVEALGGANNGLELVKRSPLVREAIFIASSALVASLSRPEQNSPRKLRQLYSSVLRYTVRMSSRTTPFGLFAGVGQIDIGDYTALPLGAVDTWRHHSRLGMEWLLEWIKLLESDPSIQSSLVYTYQPIVVRIGNRYHFEHWDENDNLTTTSVIVTPGIEKLIEKTRKGKKYATLFKQMLAELPDATPETMSAFLNKFAKYGIIRSSLYPPLTCADPASYVAGCLERIPAARNIAKQFRTLLQHIEHYDTYAPGCGERALRELVGEARELHQPTNKRLPFNIDLGLQFAGKAQLQQSVADDAAELAELLLRLSEHDLAKTMLSPTAEKFAERYGTHRLVPLFEVLNPNVGIGPPSHYQNGRHAPVGPSSAHLARRGSLLLKLALQATRDGRQIIQLDKAAIEQLTNPDFKSWPLPDSLDIGIQVAASSLASMNKGDYLIVNSPLIGAQAAGRSAGRFAELLGARTVAYLEQIADITTTKRQDCLHVELAYMPRTDHAANVAIRPALYTHEVALGVAPGVPSRRIIALDDIQVGVRQGRLYLWSATHQKEIVVHSSTMLNRGYAPSACRFLLDVSEGNQAMLKAFSWGTAAYLPMLPRIVHGRCVLALATWWVESDDILQGVTPDKKTGRPSMDIDAWFSHVSVWRAKWQVPRFVYLTDSDNRLLLDLQSKVQVMELFYALTKHGNRGALRLEEALPGPDDAWIQDARGHYLQEYVIQLVSGSNENAKNNMHPQPTFVVPVYEMIHATERTYLPGSQWLYCKLYIPKPQQGEYLTHYVKQLVQRVSDHGAANSWFFVRYTDPEPHIRLRFNMKETEAIRTLPIIFAWVQQMQRVGLLQRFVIDSYDREIERYGGSVAIKIAEDFFAAESISDLELLTLSDQRALGGRSLSDVVVLSTSILLSVFGLSDSQQKAWAGRWQSAYKEFASEYRNNRADILALFHDYRNTQLRPTALQVACSRLECELAPFGQAYQQLEKSNQLTLPLNDIISSFIHMHHNRLIGIDHRLERRALVYVGKILNDLPKWRQRT